MFLSLNEKQGLKSKYFDKDCVVITAKSVYIQDNSCKHPAYMSVHIISALEL